LGADCESRSGAFCSRFLEFREMLITMIEAFETA
jgi:hypothetical protein